MARWREWLPRVAVESMLIVLSILLALAVDQWRESRSRAERAELALAAIQAEMRENRRLVEKALDYHVTLADTLSVLAERGVNKPPPGAYPQGLAAPGRVIRTAWETARSTGTIVDLPYPVVLRLSRVYGRQAEYEELSRALLHTAYTQVASEGVEAFLRGYANWIGVAQDFAGRERILLEAYDAALRATSP